MSVSPRPWKLSDDGIIWDAEGQAVLNLDDGIMTREDAEFMVEAVNAYEEEEYKHASDCKCEDCSDSDKHAPGCKCADCEARRL